MKKIKFYLILAAVILMGSSFSAHKFYVSIYQIHFNENKKSVEITSRIFIDDLNKALEKKSGRVIHLGETGETPEDIAAMKKYISDNFVLTINGKQMPFVFLSKEMESNVLICYFKITDVPKIRTFQVSNKILFDLVTEQQNVIQTNIYGKKNSLLLTIDEQTGKVAL